MDNQLTADFKRLINEFFSSYEAHFNEALAEPPIVHTSEVAGAFADCFVQASPAGVACGSNNEDFHTQIPRGFEFYRSRGMKSMHITSINIARMDAHHAVARVRWDSRYARMTGAEDTIEFEVFYFLQILDRQPKIFAYITGDEQKALQEKGLV